MPTDFTTLDLEYAWVRPRLQGGERIPNAVENTLAAGITFRDPCGGLFGTIRVQSYGPAALIEDNSSRSDVTTIVNASAGYQGTNWRLAVDIFNLFDAKTNAATAAQVAQNDQALMGILNAHDDSAAQVIPQIARGDEAQLQVVPWPVAVDRAVSQETREESGLQNAVPRPENSGTRLAHALEQVAKESQQRIDENYGQLANPDTPIINKAAIAVDSLGAATMKLTTSIAEGFIGEGVDAVTSLANAAMHPVGTVVGIASGVRRLATHPVQTVTTVGQNISAAFRDDPANATGRIAFNIATIYLPTKLTRLQVLNGVQKVDDVATALRTTEMGVDAASAARMGLKGGFYEINGFRFQQSYYEKLWMTGRPSPGLRAESVLLGATSKVPDAIKEGFYRYVHDGWEMIYNPTTGEVWHLQPVK